MKKLIPIIIITLTFFGCYDDEEWIKKRNNEMSPLFEYENIENLRANGTDTLIINIKFPIKSDRELLKVELKTEEGIFIESKEKKLIQTIYTTPFKISEDKIIFEAKMKTSTKLGLHIVEMEVPEIIKRRLHIRFQESHAASLNLTASKFAVKADYLDEIEFSAIVKAESGFVHQGTKVFFNAADSIEYDNVLYFRELTKTNDKGVATIKFTPGDMNGYRGVIPILAYTYDELGMLISDTTFVRVIEPSK